MARPVRPQFTEVCQRLDQWGMWCSEYDQQRAWPTETLLHRVMKQGPDGAVIRATFNGNDIPSEVEEIDLIVAGMEIPQMKVVIYTEYIERAIPRPSKYRKAKMRERTYRNWLDRGWCYVLGQLRG